MWVLLQQKEKNGSFQNPEIFFFRFENEAINLLQPLQEPTTTRSWRPSTPAASRRLSTTCAPPSDSKRQQLRQVIAFRKILPKLKKCMLCIHEGKVGCRQVLLITRKSYNETCTNLSRAVLRK